MTLSVQELKDKIYAVENDLRTQENEKGRIALSSYLDYLKFELSEAERAERSNKGS
jgi:hypothetical protein